MAGKNQVTLTFAGDETQLSKAFDNVGSAAKRMDTDVATASKSIGDSAGGFDRAGEAADGAEGKAQGFSDTLTGTSDIMAGAGQIAQGNLFEGFVTAGQGAADLAGGLASFMIPALKGGVTWIKNTTVAQKLLNTAMRLNPIGLVITALTLLVGGFIIAYKKSETFRNIVNGALGAVKKVGQSVFGWFRDNWKTITSIMLAPFSLVIKPIWKHRDSILNAIKAVPGAIAGFMKNVASIISAPFRAAFNAVRNFWNNTIGGKGFTVPGWVPEIGGKGFTIPRFHSGGIVPGGLGSESLAVLRAGERVTAGAGSGGGTLMLQSDGSRAGDLLLQLFKETLRVKDGAAYRVVFGG